MARKEEPRKVWNWAPVPINKLKEGDRRKLGVKESDQHPTLPAVSNATRLGIAETVAPHQNNGAPSVNGEKEKAPTLEALAANVHALTKIGNPTFLLAGARLWATNEEAKIDEWKARLALATFLDFTNVDEVKRIYHDPSLHKDHELLVTFLRFLSNNKADIMAEMAKVKALSGAQ